MSRPVRVVTDSACDVPPALAVELGITVVPLSVRFGDETYLDGVDLSGEAFFRRLRQESALPKTSLPPPALFASAYQDLLARDSDVISIHVSSKVSGTYGSARTAAQGFPADRVRVLDTLLATVSAGLVVRQAALVARDGMDLEVVADRTLSCASRGALFALIDTLEYLRRGGRIGRVAAILGGLLAVKPIISIKDGEPIPVARVRTRGQGLERLVDLVVGDAPFDGPIMVGHGDDRPTAENVRDRIRERLPDVESIIGEIGAVIGTHGGPRAVGVGLIRAKAAEQALS